MVKNLNIEIPDDLHRDLKLDAIQNDKTLKDLIIEILKN